MTWVGTLARRFALLSCAATALQAQAGAPLAVTVLAGPAVEFPEPFNRIGELAELGDGRVLVSDVGDRRLILVDLRHGTMSDAARVGSGPGEFRSASPMIAAPHGAVWVWDFAQDRILVFDATGRIAQTRPAGTQAASVILPRAADSSGAIFGEFRGWSREPQGLVQEPFSAVVRRRGARADTVALIQPVRRPHRTARDRYVVRADGFATRDAWGVFPDGRVLIVRGERYEPEVILPDGTRRKAPAIPFTPIPVTAADRRAQLAATQRALADARGRSGSADDARRFRAIRASEPLAWATTKPPLRGDAILVDSRDRAWVPVHDAREQAGWRYDLLDREGRRVGAVRLPPGEELAGFGRQSIYTIRQDADELTYLRRYPMVTRE